MLHTRYWLLYIKTKLESLVQFFRENNILSVAVKKISRTNFSTKKRDLSRKMYYLSWSKSKTRESFGLASEIKPWGFRTWMKNFIEALHWRIEVMALPFQICAKLQILEREEHA